VPRLNTPDGGDTRADGPSASPRICITSVRSIRFPLRQRLNWMSGFWIRAGLQPNVNVLNGAIQQPERYRDYVEGQRCSAKPLT
jgi:hypothetical protein